MTPTSRRSRIWTRTKKMKTRTKARTRKRRRRLKRSTPRFVFLPAKWSGLTDFLPDDRLKRMALEICHDLGFAGVDFCDG